MFLAIKEIRHEKFRYSLIVAVISLISFLIFILSALSLGLANENTAAITSWQTQSALMTKDANGNMGQSLLTKKQSKIFHDDKNVATVGITPANIKKKGTSQTQSAQFIGLESTQYIFQNLKLISGKKPATQHEVVVSNKFENLQVGNKIKIGLDTHLYTIVGIVNDAQYNMAPVVYGDIDNWSTIKGVGTKYSASGFISKKNDNLKVKDNNLVTYSKHAYLNKLPGYSAQNTTFAFMIVFLIIISLVIITIFLYILTIQKLPNLSVLRAQGIPSNYLLKNTFGEAFVILSIAIVFGLLVTILTATVIPSTVPMYFDTTFIILVAVGILLTGLIGALVPMRIISKIDPVTAIGG